MGKSDNQGDKGETFIQTSGRGRDGQPGQRGLVARQWLADQVRWWLAEQAVPHFHADKLGGRTGRSNWGMRQTTQPRVPGWGNKASKPLTENTCGRFEAAVGETPSLTGEFIGETLWVLEHTQTHLPGNQH